MRKARVVLFVGDTPHLGVNQTTADGACKPSVTRILTFGGFLAKAAHSIILWAWCGVGDVVRASGGSALSPSDLRGLVAYLGKIGLLF